MPRAKLTPEQRLTLRSAIEFIKQADENVAFTFLEGMLSGHIPEVDDYDAIRRLASDTPPPEKKPN